MVQNADNVYLIFSANKSGEYFGYARMCSPIEGSSITSNPKAAPEGSPSGLSDGPKAIPTPATEWAPKGRIIDDSARGTIFWEAEHSDSEDPLDMSPSLDHDSSTLSPQSTHGRGGESSKNGQDWGRPFQIEWISTNRLPFYRTRGLRNSWNANREVKIARDGTELETSVGKRLVQMFHRSAQGGGAGAGAAGLQQQQQQQHQQQQNIVMGGPVPRYTQQHQHQHQQYR